MADVFEVEQKGISVPGSISTQFWTLFFHVLPPQNPKLLKLRQTNGRNGFGTGINMWTYPGTQFWNSKDFQWGHGLGMSAQAHLDRVRHVSYDPVTVSGLPHHWGHMAA